MQARFPANLGGPRACAPPAGRLGSPRLCGTRSASRHRPPIGPGPCFTCLLVVLFCAPRARSSAGERPPDTGEVTGSIPVAPTIFSKTCRQNPLIGRYRNAPSGRYNTPAAPARRAAATSSSPYWARRRCCASVDRGPNRPPGRLPAAAPAALRPPPRAPAPEPPGRRRPPSRGCPARHGRATRTACCRS